MLSIIGDTEIKIFLFADQVFVMAFIIFTNGTPVR